MSTEAKKSAKARQAKAPASAAGAMRLATDQPDASGPRWYIRQQGRNFELLQATERPNTKHAKDARLVALRGPYASEAIARMMFARLTEGNFAVDALELDEGVEAE
jgi:hypothetical protein